MTPYSWKNMHLAPKIVLLAMVISSITACSQQQDPEQQQKQPNATKDKISILKSNKQAAFSLAVGTCFNDVKKLTGKAVVKKLAVIACDKPHDNEIYHGYELTIDTYPTEKDDLLTTCGSEFEKFVGHAYETSQYDYDLMMPTRSSWTDGDRRVLCLLYDGDYKKLSSSVEKTGKIDDQG